MRLARHPIRARTVLCVLALALWVATTLGLVHRTIHNPLAAPAHVHSVASAHAGEADHGSHGLVALFSDHSDADCRLYDQLSQGPAALCVPALLLPVLLPAASFAYLEGEAIARWVALFEARGPPPAR
jgi:hypothetical protein